MTHSEIAGYRQRLEELKARVGGEVTTLQAEALRPIGSEDSGGLSDLPRHPGDRSSAAYEEDVALELLGNEGHILGEVEAALARIDAGRFGLCTACGADLTKERLAVVPYARYCVHCEKKEE
jgi:RNA polymerase-binding transcription factor DksA